MVIAFFLSGWDLQSGESPCNTCSRVHLAQTNGRARASCLRCQTPDSLVGEKTGEEVSRETTLLIREGARAGGH